MTPSQIFRLGLRKGIILFSLFGSIAFAQSDSTSVLTISEIRILGNQTTKDHVILREMFLQEGDSLTAEGIEHDQKRIFDLQLFNRVDLYYTAEEKTRRGEKKAILYVVVHERWYIFPIPIVGIKYRDPKNLYYGGALLHQNFRGRNEKFFGLLTFGFDRWFEINYFNPKLISSEDFFLRTYFLLGKIKNLRPDQDVFDRDRMSGRILVGKRFGFYEHLSLWIDYDLWSVPEGITGAVLSPSGRDQFPSIGLSYLYDSRDLREYSTNGLAFMIFATKIGLGNSPVDFFRYGYSLKSFFPVAENISLGTRAFGTISKGTGIPPYRLLYFGYEERIRGYFSRILEGENIMGGNLELRIPIISPRYLSIPFIPVQEFAVLRYGLYAGIFADAGKVWNRNEHVLSRPWYAGYGGGLHFLLPYSLVIRTEYAWNDSGRGEFVFDIGASF